MLFKFLESSLHFVELNEDEEFIKKNDPRYKLGKLMELLNERFYKYYKLNQNITIDETMVNFKGTNSMKFTSLQNHINGVLNYIYYQKA